MNLSLIVAVSREGAIGRDGDLPWRLSSDLRRFKSLTMGHHLLMGRKTYESIGRALPGRTMVVVSRNSEFRAEQAIVVNDLDAALEIARQDAQPFVIGGAELYRSLLPHVRTIHLTRVDASIPDADTFFPEVDWNGWELLEQTSVESSEKDEFSTSYEVYRRT